MPAAELWPGWKEAPLPGSMEMGKAKDALRWAASTYVIAALGSLATLLYYIMIYTSRM
jgi:Zn-dependent membrane protease YugP